MGCNITNLCSSHWTFLYCSGLSACAAAKWSFAPFQRMLWYSSYMECKSCTVLSAFSSTSLSRMCCSLLHTSLRKPFLCVSVRGQVFAKRLPLYQAAVLSKRDGIEDRLQVLQRNLRLHAVFLKFPVSLAQFQRNEQHFREIVIVRVGDGFVSFQRFLDALQSLTPKSNRFPQTMNEDIPMLDLPVVFATYSRVPFRSSAADFGPR